MAEGDNGRRRGDDAFDVDDILPELSEFDPDLDDLLDLSEAPEPLPAPPDPPTPPRSQPWRPTPPPNRPEPPRSEPVERDAPPPERPEPGDHRLSERPSPPEQRRPSPPPAAPEPPRESWLDDDLEVPDFVRSEPEAAEPDAPVEEREPVREEWRERVERREPEWPAAPSPEPPETRSPGGDSHVDDLMPPEPEGPAFIDRVVERRREVEPPSWESPRLEPEPEPIESESSEPEPRDDVWMTDERDAGAEVYEESVDEPKPVEPVEPVEPSESTESVEAFEAFEEPEVRHEPGEAGDVEGTEPFGESEGAPVDPLAPAHEPAAVPPPDEAPPRMPGAPVSEIDSFAAQLGDLLSTDEPEPGPAETGEAGTDPATGTHEPLASSEVGPAPPAPEAPPAPPRVATALATRAPTPAEFAPMLPPLPTVAFRRTPCAEGDQRVEARTEADSLPSSYPWAIRAAIVVLALAAAAAVVLTNPRSGDDDSGDEAAPAVADVEEAAGDDPEAVAPAEAQEPATPVDAGVNLVAEADVPLVDVYPDPDAPQADASLEHPTEVGGPLVFLVEEQRGEWLRVRLPVSDDGETGWVQAEQVTLSRHEYRIEVRLSEHRLEMFRGDESVFATGIAVGGDAPEPGSEFYIKELLKPPNPDSTYGEYAFGFSGFSNTLDKFTSGKDVVAIHGVDDPSVIGTDVAAGCIGMTNDDLGELVGELPLGTPVELLT